MAVALVPRTDSTNAALTKSHSKIFSEWAKEKDPMKFINYITQWFSLSTNVPARVKNVGAFAGDVKNLRSLVNIPTSLFETTDAISAFKQKRQEGKSNREAMAFAGRDITRKFTDFLNDTCDGLELGARFFKYSTKNIDGFSSGATFVGSLNNLTDDVAKIRSKEKSPTEQHKIQYGLGIAASVIYAFVGALGLFTFFTSVAVPAVVTLALLTSGVVFTTSQFFYRNIVDPEKENQDPRKVLEALQRA